MNFVILFPFLIPLVFAIATLMLMHKQTWMQPLSLAGSTLHLVSSVVLFAAVSQHGTISMQLGSWPAPFGITFVADMFSALMLVAASFIGVVINHTNLTEVTREKQGLGYYVFYMVLLTGVSGAFLTGDIFNLYVWFEVMLISSFALLMLGDDGKLLDAGLKYVVLNILATTLILIAVGLLYSAVGTLNMADLAIKIHLAPATTVLIISVLFIIAVGMKSAVFPFFYWLPASYPAASNAVGALFAALLTKVGVYVLYRLFSTIFTVDVHFTHSIIAWLSVLTLIIGVFGAVASKEWRQLLSFVVISHIGYMLLGLSVFDKSGLGAGMFYMINHMMIICALFLFGGVFESLTGASSLRSIKGLFTRYPSLIGLWVIPACAISGIPPFSGFWGKFAIIRSLLNNGDYLFAGAALATGFLTLYAFVKVWLILNQKVNADIAHAHPLPPITRQQLAPIFILDGIIIVISLFPNSLFVLTQYAASGLLEKSNYVRTVLGL